MKESVKEKTRTNLSLDKEAKEKAKEIFSQLGLSLSEAVNIFLIQSVYKKGLPFPIEIPNEETKRAIDNARKGKNLDEVSLDQLKEESKQCLK
jgi:DNA-damage-inducible protein J